VSLTLFNPSLVLGFSEAEVARKEDEKKQAQAQGSQGAAPIARFGLVDGLGRRGWTVLLHR